MLFLYSDICPDFKLPKNIANIGLKQTTISGFENSIPNNAGTTFDEIRASSADRYMIAGVPTHTKDASFPTISLIHVKFEKNKICAIQQKVF